MKRISLEEFFKTFQFSGCENIFTRGLSTQIEDLRIIVALCRYFKSKRVLELGVRYGHSARYILSQCPDIQKYVGVDVPFSFIPPREKQKEEIPLQTGIMAFSDKRFMPKVLENGTEDIRNNIDMFGHKFDLIFVDADHTMSGIIRDTEISHKIIEKNGIIIWHDYGNEPDITNYLDSLSMTDDKVISIEDSYCCFKNCN